MHNEMNEIMKEIMKPNSSYLIMAQNILQDKYQRELIISEITFDWCKNPERVIAKYNENKNALLYYFIKSFKLQLYSKTSSYYRSFKREQLIHLHNKEIAEHKIEDKIMYEYDFTHENNIELLKKIIEEIKCKEIDKTIFKEYHFQEKKNITYRSLGIKYSLHHTAIFHKIKHIKQLIQKKIIDIGYTRD